MKGQGIDKVLVTGGCGFVGSHTVDFLIKRGYAVTVLDNLDKQVHTNGIPEYLNKKSNFVKGDIRDRQLTKKLVKDTDAILHLASAVGVGQSMYQVENYIDCNTRGTASLLDILVNEDNNVKKIVMASSMSIYGEGEYYCVDCDEVQYPKLREEDQLQNRLWNPLCSECRNQLVRRPTNEDKPLVPTSIYAMSKRHQEETCLLIGDTYDIPTVALRYFNIYGPRQSLSNPYTGVCAIFGSRILNGNPPYIFEDGEQVRDFVHVSDIVNANLLALETNSAENCIINIGSGKATSINKIAECLIEMTGAKLKPIISQKYRKGDIRHCYADITRARNILGYSPSIDLMDGLLELTSWMEENKWSAKDNFKKTLEELEKRSLAKGG